VRAHGFVSTINLQPGFEAMYPSPHPSFGDQFMWDCITGGVRSETQYDLEDTDESRNQLTIEGSRGLEFCLWEKRASRD
jgi:hypothetical protein